MLFLLLKSIYIITLSFVYGNSVFPNEKEQIIIYPVAKSMVGLAIISVISAILSLFIGLGLTANVIVIIVAFLLAFWKHKRLLNNLFFQIKEFNELDRYIKILLLASITFILFFSSQQSISIDEGNYHAPFIKLTEEFGVLIGAGNLGLQMGFNSHWHLLSALFNFSFLTGQESNHINASLFILLLLYCLPALDSIIKGKTSLQNYFKAAFLVFASIPHFFAYHLIAPSADLATIYFTFFIISLFLDVRKERENTDLNFIIITLLWAFLVTIKLSGIFLFPIVIFMFYHWIKLKKYRFLFLSTTIIGLVLLPWIIRNILLTGYPIFPLNIDLFKLDWKLPQKIIIDLNKIITDMAFVLYSDNAVDNSTMPIFQKIYYWFFYNLRIIDKLIISTSLILGITALIFKARSTNLFLLLTLFFCIALWLLKAPDPRFAYGYFATISILGSYLLFEKLIIKYFKILGFLVAMFFVFTQLSSYYIYQYFYSKFINDGRFKMSAENDILIMPKAYPEDSRFCWGSDINCLLEKSKNEVQLRSNSIKDGVKRK